MGDVIAILFNTHLPNHDFGFKVRSNATIGPILFEYEIAFGNTYIVDGSVGCV